MEKNAKKANNRRYYLHKKIKEFTSCDAYSKEIRVNDEILSNCSEKQKSYIQELIDLGYNAQTFIS